MNEHAALLLRHSYSHSDYYLGTRDQLIAAGLVTDGMFPGDPGRNKVSQKHAGPPVISIAKRSRTTFEVRVNMDDDEANRRQEREAARQALALADGRRRAELDALPKSAAGYRGRVLALFVDLMEFSIDHAKRAGVGYHFDADAMDEFESALSDAVAALRNGRVLFDSAARQQRLAEIQREAANIDGGFQTFMAGIAAAATTDRCADA